VQSPLLTGWENGGVSVSRNLCPKLLRHGFGNTWNTLQCSRRGKMAQTYFAAWGNGDVSIFVYPAKPSVLDLMVDIDAYGPFDEVRLYRVKTSNGEASIDIGMHKREGIAPDFNIGEGSYEEIPLLSAEEYVKQRYYYHSDSPA